MTKGQPPVKKSAKNRSVGDGTPGPGRPKGSPNKTTVALKEAILLAAEQTGQDGKGKGGLTGYLVNLAKTEPKAFSSLLGRVLPLQVTGEGDGPLTIVVRKLTDGA